MNSIDVDDWELMTADPEWSPEPVRTSSDIARDALVVVVDVALFTLNVTGVLLNVGGHLVEGGKMLNSALTSSGTTVRSYLVKEEKSENACKCAKR